MAALSAVIQKGTFLLFPMGEGVIIKRGGRKKLEEISHLLQGRRYHS